MKIKQLLRLAAFTLFFSGLAFEAFAVPAPPSPVKVTLPDGSTITVRMIGDEYFMYETTSDGYNVVRQEDGFYYYAEDTGRELVSTGIRASDPGRRTAAEHAALSKVSRNAPGWGVSAALRSPLKLAGNKVAVLGGVPDHVKETRAQAMQSGEKFKSLVILVNFSDKSFSTPNPKQTFSNILNQDGYSYNGATGSAWNYYYDNSNGRFDPQFDVVGPYTVPQNRKHYSFQYNYGQLIEDAVRLASADVDFSQYADNGYARDIYVFYAGEASNSISVWPHRSYIDDVTYNGVIVSGYACSAEFETSNPALLTNIGTFCHEFGHVLGWPDFYDINYSETHQAVTLDRYSLMDAGSYNNISRTPPSLTAMERVMMKWAEPEVLETGGAYTLQHISKDKAYRINTMNEGEYYLVEYRSSKSGNKWDAGLKYPAGLSPTQDIEGLFITHVDQSGNVIPGSGGRTARELWDMWFVNMYGVHPCFRVVKANQANPESWLFPGAMNVTSIDGDSHSEFRPWSFLMPPYAFTDITPNGDRISFSLHIPEITLDKTEYSLTPGRKVKLNGVISPEVFAGLGFEWSSDAAPIATVDQDGWVTGVAAGIAVITAKARNSDKQAECVITVTSPDNSPQAVMVNQNDVWLEWRFPNYAGDYIVEMMLDDKIVDTITTTEQWAYSGKLMPGTSYTALIYLCPAEVKGALLGETTFNTQNIGNFPAFLNIAETGDGKMILILEDVGEQIKEIEWSVDGDVLEYPEFTARPGARHEVRVTYDTGAYSETITRIVTIK